jgi:hypothetical protein
VITLASALTATICDPCTIELAAVEERVFVDDRVYLTSNVWYVHPEVAFVAGRVMLLSINGGGLLRSVMGTPFRDGQRDGDEVRSPPVADDEFLLQFSLRSGDGARFTASRLNDGTLYGTVANSLAFACAGAATEPICALPVADECPAATPAQAVFSLYTADGSHSTPLGVADLIDTNRLPSAPITLLDRSGKPLAGRTDTAVVLHNVAGASFPTTLLTFTLIEREPDACAAGRLRGFRPGDRMVVSSLIRSVGAPDPGTLDGNGDGIAEASVKDDWVGEWDVTRQTFVPIQRLIRR